MSKPQHVATAAWYYSLDLAVETGMSTKMLTGSFVALITPFNRDGSVDFAAFRTLLKFQEDQGTSAVLIMGSTGETSMLSPEEKKQIIVETAKMKTSHMPIFFGCTGNNTESTVANVRFAKDNGADGAILAAPAYICAPESDIERFFLDVADATDLPLGIYNNPPRVKSDLHWDHLLRIFKHSNYVVHKESTARVGQVAQVLAECLIEFLNQDARDAVDRPAGRVGHDHGDRSGGVGLRRRGCGEHAEKYQCQPKRTDATHMVLVRDVKLKPQPRRSASSYSRRSCRARAR